MVAAPVHSFSKHSFPTYTLIHVSSEVTRAGANHNYRCPPLYTYPILYTYPNFTRVQYFTRVPNFARVPTAGDGWSVLKMLGRKLLPRCSAEVPTPAQPTTTVTLTLATVHTLARYSVDTLARYCVDTGLETTSNKMRSTLPLTNRFCSQIIFSFTVDT